MSTSRRYTHRTMNRVRLVCRIENDISEIGDIRDHEDRFARQTIEIGLSLRHDLGVYRRFPAGGPLSRTSDQLVEKREWLYRDRVGDPREASYLNLPRLRERVDVGIAELVFAFESLDRHVIIGNELPNEPGENRRLPVRIQGLRSCDFPAFEALYDFTRLFD